ncbi:MAG: TolC family protein [Myxococcota bacterium]
MSSIVAVAVAAGSASAATPEADEPPEAMGRPVTLGEILAFAHEHAPQVLEARARVRLGEAAVEGAGIPLRHNPELETSLDADVTGEGVTRWEVGVRQRVEVAGQRGLRREAARKSRRALRRSVDEADWRVHEQVHRLFRRGLVARKRLELEREILAFSEEILGYARKRYEAGEEPRLSVLVSEAELARARQRMVKRRTAYLRSLHALAEAAGWTEEEPPAPEGDLVEPTALPSADALVQRAMDHDPRLVTLGARLEEVQATQSLARRKAWPDPAFGLGYEHEDVGLAVEKKLLFSLSVPIPAWNRNDAEVAKADARAAVVRQRIENRRTTLRTRLMERIEAVDGAAEQVAVFETGVLPAFREQLALLLKGFELGEMSLLDVMTARDRLLAAQREALDAHEDYHEAISALEELLGAPVWDEHHD